MSRESTREALRNIAGAGIAIVAITAMLHFINAGPQAAPDFDGKSPGPEVIITVAKGDSGDVIAKKLNYEGVVKSSSAFFRLAVADERSNRIAVGNHRIQTVISARMALEQLLDSDRIVDLIKVRDGAWISEISQSLIESGFSKSEIERALKVTKPPKEFGAKSLEGFLYPAFYSFQPGEEAGVALAAMIDRFNFSTKDVEWDKVKGFSRYEILIIASLIETEGTPDVHGKVSRVIFNRLAQGMPLQLDSTVHYILQRRGEIRVSLKETQVQSKYNTFQRVGLPPTPIGSPTRASIDAAINPEKGDWLYFVTVKPGETKFTASYDEFLLFKAEYKKNFAAGLFS